MMEDGGVKSLHYLALSTTEEKFRAIGRKFLPEAI
jgi:hypothetical protein